MLSNKAAGVASIASGLTSKAGRVGGVVLREVLGIEDFLRMIIRHRYFGRRNQRKTPIVTNMEEVVFELRKLIRGEQCRSIYRKRRQRLGISMFGRVDVEHEIYQSTLEPGAGTVQDRKPRAGDLCRPFEVQ